MSILPAGSDGCHWGDITITSHPEQSSGPGGLATRPAVLAPQFPEVDSGTRLALYESKDDGVVVRWGLSTSDLVRYGADFPSQGGMPVAALRLSRVDGEMALECLAEKPLALNGRGGEGEARFSVPGAGGIYVAELGLINCGGGWLLLERSNRLTHGARIGLDFSRLVAEQGARCASGGDDGADASVGMVPPAIARLLVERSGLPVGVAGDPLRTHLAQLQGEQASDMVPVDPDADLEALPAPSTADGPAAAQQALPGKTVDAASVPPSAIPVRSYGRCETAAGGLVIEAELHIEGWCAPNTEIDLFGIPYQVGPGGRFSLRLKVDDPQLLRQALAQSPPPQLDIHR